MVRRLSVAAALWLLAAAGPAQAMGLGDIKVKSSLNQRFSASIPFTSLSPEEAANVRARLADNEAFQRAGLDRSAYVGTIRIDAITDGPNPRLELSSKDLAREPLITLLVEIRTPGGTRVLREYTVLLDPAVTPATMNQSASANSEFFQTPEERAGGGGNGTYGPVGPTETLWMVAQAVKPNGVGLDQAMLALYETNRGAFRGGDIDALRKGSVLNVPSAERMQAVSNTSARARVLELSSQDQGTTVSKSSPFSSGEPPAPPRSATLPPPPPPPVVAAPLAPPPPVTPPPSTATEPAATTTTPTTPSAGGEAATPATGETAATTPPAATESTESTGTTSAEPPAVAEGATPATDGTAPAEATPAAGEEGGSSSDWISKLIPVLIGLIVLLVGFAVWRSARERKAQREYEQASREAAPSMPSPRVGATGNLASSRAAPSARAELEALDRQIDDDATRVAGADDDGDRTRMVTTSKIAPYTGPQAADREMDEDERAVTTQFQANTKEIKLGDNDPLSEADFHLAYGLYDEAALLLQQASARAPARTDLRVKLAETYFAAGKPAEFEQVASGLKGQVNDEEWGKLAILGRQLAPDSALFHGDDTTTNADTVLDLTFDDDATQIAPVKVDEGLEFNLEELELPTRAESPAASRGQALEFDLGEFDLSGSEGKGAGSKKAASPSDSMQLKDFDLAGSNLAGPGKSGLDVRLDEVEPMVIDDPMQDDLPSSTDDAATKLDLARAYVEMGDSEMARSLLDEVAKIGTDDQKREAGALRERLLG